MPQDPRVSVRLGAESFFPQPSTLFGMRVIIDAELPRHPSPADEARWIVQDGMREIMEWCGLPMMRKPETTHAYAFDASVFGPTVAISSEVWRLLRTESLLTVQPGPSLDAMNSLWRARNEYLMRRNGVVSF